MARYAEWLVYADWLVYAGWLVNADSTISEPTIAADRRAFHTMGRGLRVHTARGLHPCVIEHALATGRRVLRDGLQRGVSALGARQRFRGLSVTRRCPAH